MNKINLILLFYFLNLKVYGQELYSNKRVIIALETMAQSQINIGGLKNASINSEKLSVRSISFGVEPMFGMIFNLRTSSKSYINTAIRFGMYKTTTQVKFIIPDAFVTQKVIAKRIVLGAPIIYNTFINKKYVVGIGVEFFFDIADEIQLKTKFNNNSSTNLLTTYTTDFGDAYKSIGIIVQGKYRLNKRIDFKLSCNIDTQQKKAFTHTISVVDNSFVHKANYSYNPYTIRYSAGIEIRMFSF